MNKSRAEGQNVFLYDSENTKLPTPKRVKKTYKI